MEKRKENQRVVLCPACGACPEIVFHDDEITIGEEDHVAKLTRGQWNDLVRKIKKGELKEV